MSADELKPCPCSDMTSRDAISKDEALRHYAELKPNFWTISEDFKSLKRSFVCKDFSAAINFINAVAEVAERETINHHPDLHLTQYRNMEVVIYTHSASGLTVHDFILAKEIEKIEVQYSKQWLKSQA
jgi:4a-hydroxytetrahydrobiopterin dehydratase